VADASSEHRTGPPLQRSPSLRAAVRDAADYLAAMQEVVPIRTSAEVTTWERPRDDRRADELAERYKVTGPVRRLRAALAG
jgi:hypothetical protein